MIRAIELENFKGIGARTRIELAPVTLLFGANNAGKSTILQALLFMHEALRRGSAEIDRTELGDDALELGGFSRIVHRHDRTRTIIVRVEFDTPGTLNRLGRNLDQFPFPDLDDDIDSAWVEIHARHPQGHIKALIESARIGVGGEPLVWLYVGNSLREGAPAQVQVNLGHPILNGHGSEIASEWESSALQINALGSAFSKDFDKTFGSGRAFGAGARGDGFTDDRALPIFTISRTRPSAIAPLNEPLRLVTNEDGYEDAPAASVQSEIKTFLEMVILGISGQLADALGKALYIGPLRAVPPRGSLFERSGTINRWADGLAAWDALLADRGTLLESTNFWLKELGAGCQIIVQQLFAPAASAEDVTSEHVDVSVRRLMLDTGSGSFVLPSEVGAGISQVIPVIVAALLPARAGLVMIEQPEIHVHPALQVELGDLFIESAADRQLFIETHSEHLILRLLRRIRETVDGELPLDAPAFTAEKLSVLYVESMPEGAGVRRLRVDKSGEFLDRWPKGFFEERTEELF